jgi:hypothetical protein
MTTEGVMRGLSLLLAMTIGVGLSACQSAPPPIGAHLPGGTWDEVSHVFDTRVQSRFLVGSSEADMLAELHREHFNTRAFDKATSRYQFAAVADRQGLPCRLFWNIEWNSDAGKITEIAGKYSGTCL